MIFSNSLFMKGVKMYQNEQEKDGSYTQDRG
jgi:hypothetical protein